MPVCCLLRQSPQGLGGSVCTGYDVGLAAEDLRHEV